jgi:hypothetical protein
MTGPIRVAQFVSGIRPQRYRERRPGALPSADLVGQDRLSQSWKLRWRTVGRLGFVAQAVGNLYRREAFPRPHIKREANPT